VASEVEICNLALSHLGDEATVASIDPPEGSAQAEHCARFYRVARDVVLELHAWSFATHRVQLAQLEVPAWNWTYAYAKPASCIKVLAVLPYAADSNAVSEDYEMESAADGAGIIRTNVENATCRYIRQSTDTAKFSPLLVESISRLLASYLAGPVVKGDAGRKAALEQMQMFRVSVGQAMESDASQRKWQPEHTPPWIGVR
jgi:hypothetical protein